VSARRAHRKLRLELLRARAAADRIELTLAVQDIVARLAPLQRALDSIGSVAGALGARARTISWAVAAGVALVRLLARGSSRISVAALTLFGLASIARLVRRSRRSKQPDSAV
jgi:hypothetical protein